MALASGVDGVIGTFFHLTNENLMPLFETGTAVVQMDGKCQEAGDLPIDRVYIDNHAASLTAVRHLIEQGHRAIAVVGAGDVLVGQERVRGYLHALTEANITPHPGWIQMGDFSQESGYRAMQALLSSEHPPTAVFAANDLVAYGALFALREHRLRIPDDVALVGYDDLPASQLISPALTSINQSQHVLGQQAVEMLLERLDGRRSGAGRCREIPFQLIVRASSVAVTRSKS
jgi:LacI family transcriptional regulator